MSQPPTYSKLHIPTSSYLKSFKNTNHSPQAKQRQSHKNSYIDRKENRISLKQQTNHAKESWGKNKAKKEKSEENPKSINFLMYENSMEELLNSSITQFERLIQEEEDSHSLEKQNSRLKKILAKMKSIMREKLEAALQKQKQDISKMLEDYVSLITKLLQDKESLTIAIENLQMSHHKAMKEKQEQIEKIENDRNLYIESTKGQVDQFLQLIEHYEEESKNQHEKFITMQKQIEQLEEQKQYLLHNYCDQNTGFNENHNHQMNSLQTQLQKMQEENGRMEEENGRIEEENRKIKQNYVRKLEEQEEAHEEEFLEYEKAIKETLIKKDTCIERLNTIIDGLRGRKCLA